MEQFWDIVIVNWPLALEYVEQEYQTVELTSKELGGSYDDNATQVEFGNNYAEDVSEEFRGPPCPGCCQQGCRHGGCLRPSCRQNRGNPIGPKCPSCCPLCRHGACALPECQKKCPSCCPLCKHKACGLPHCRHLMYQSRGNPKDDQKMTRFSKDKP